MEEKDILNIWAMHSYGVRDFIYKSSKYLIFILSSLCQLHQYFFIHILYFTLFWVELVLSRLFLLKCLLEIVLVPIFFSLLSLHYLDVDIFSLPMASFTYICHFAWNHFPSYVEWRPFNS